MDGSNRNTRSTANWAELLDKVDHMLAGSAAAAERCEQALAATTSESDADFQAAWKVGMERLEEGLRCLEACAARAEERAGTSDTCLREAEEALRNWQIATRNLATGTGPSVR